MLQAALRLGVRQPHQERYLHLYFQRDDPGCLFASVHSEEFCLLSR